MPRETKAERERRVAAVGRDGHARAKLALGTVGRDPGTLAVDDHAGHRSAARRLVDDRPPDGNVRLEHRASGDRAREQSPVDVAAHERAPDPVARVTAFDDDAVLAGEAHALYRQPAR